MASPSVLLKKLGVSSQIQGRQRLFASAAALGARPAIFSSLHAPAARDGLGRGRSTGSTSAACFADQIALMRDLFPVASLSRQQTWLEAHHVDVMDWIRRSFAQVNKQKSEKSAS